MIINYKFYTPSYEVSENDKLITGVDRENKIIELFDRDGKKVVQDILDRKKAKSDVDARGLYFHPELKIIGLVRVPEGGIIDKYKEYIHLFHSTSINDVIKEIESLLKSTNNNTLITEINNLINKILETKEVSPKTTFMNSSNGILYDIITIDDANKFNDEGIKEAIVKSIDSNSPYLPPNNSYVIVNSMEGSIVKKVTSEVLGMGESVKITGISSSELPTIISCVNDKSKEKIKEGLLRYLTNHSEIRFLDLFDGLLYANLESNKWIPINALNRRELNQVGDEYINIKHIYEQLKHTRFYFTENKDTAINNRDCFIEQGFLKYKTTITERDSVYGDFKTVNKIEFVSSIASFITFTTLKELESVNSIVKNFKPSCSYYCMETMTLYKHDGDSKFLPAYTFTGSNVSQKDIDEITAKIDNLYNKTSNPFNFKGSLEKQSDLTALSDPAIGDTYIIKETNSLVIFDGTNWSNHPIGTVYDNTNINADLSNYVKNEEYNSFKEDIQTNLNSTINDVNTLKTQKSDIDLSQYAKKTDIPTIDPTNNNVIVNNNYIKVINNKGELELARLIYCAFDEENNAEKFLTLTIKDEIEKDITNGVESFIVIDMLKNSVSILHKEKINFI